MHVQLKILIFTSFDCQMCRTIFYGEYNNSGAGANLTLRAPYVQRLNDSQASLFLNMSFIEGDQWLQSYM